MIGCLMSNLISVLCVDDHPLMRDGIANALSQHADISLVAEAKNGAEGIEAYRRYHPDVTLMDLRMPGMDGLAAIAEIVAEDSGARIVVLTTYSGDVQATRALKLGAMGYLLKGTLRTDLVNTIRQVHAGRRCIPSEIAEEIANHCTTDELSAREIDVLRCVAAGNSNKIVADLLGIAEDTVKGHMRNLLAKLQANDRTHAVMIAMKRGYLNG